MTTQISDQFLFDGKRYKVLGEIPLPKDVKLSGYGVRCSACWRGYIVRWEVINGLLHLVGELNANKENDDLKGDWVGIGPVANRVSGRWRIVPFDAKVTQSARGGYASRYSEEYVVTIQNGRPIELKEDARPPIIDTTAELLDALGGPDPDHSFKVVAMMKKYWFPSWWQRILNRWF